uniref:Uncharacterized protein n=1 Tax=Corethron hystrix TaxID=216773 RepID=A0A7S1FQD4_9STRA|mmetsp:Transcript_20576/g.46675  ORF Transcript_20576/g.46675 Transcript_20576/m.46675 type:complete len:119 (+) Transcript_20576:131-487(+)
MRNLIAFQSSLARCNIRKMKDRSADGSIFILRRPTLDSFSLVRDPLLLSSFNCYPRKLLINSPRLYASTEPETAAALILPLLAYKVAAVANGQKLQWYLDASIALALVAFINLVFKSL